MDQQRKTIYSVRQEVLEGKDLREKAESFLQRAIARAAEVHRGDAAGFAAWYLKMFGIAASTEAAEQAVEKDGSSEPALKIALDHYDERERTLGPELMRKVEQYLLLNGIDSRWKDHLHAIDSLKTGIGLRGYGQLDPKNEYKREGFLLFQQLQAAVEDEIASLILRIRVSGPDTQGAGRDGLPAGDGLAASAMPSPSSPRLSYQGPAKTSGTGDGAGVPAGGGRPIAPAPRRVSAAHAFDLKRRQEQVAQAMRPAQASGGSPGPAAQGAAPRPAAPVKVVGRNDPCPCGSGKKYKKCHGS